MNTKEKKEYRKKYMGNYKKGKNSHYIALNDRMTEKEDFLLGNKEKGIEPKLSLKFNQIYERGLDSYLEEYKKSGSVLKYQLQEITNKKQKLKEEIAKLELDEKDVIRELENIDNKKRENRLKHFIKNITPLFEKFKNNNDSYIFRDFYESYKTEIWNFYDKSKFSDDLLDNTMSSDNERDSRMMDILMNKLDYSYES